MTSIRKVSAEAGVSTATVSRVLKTPEQVAPDTRTKVLAAVEKVGYRPNWLATAVNTGKSHSILVLVPNLLNAFFQKVIDGIEDAARQKGYTVLLGDTQGNVRRENEYAGMVLNCRADGLIQLDHTFPFSDSDAELAKKVPMVSVGERIAGEQAYPFVQLDNYAAGRALAHHLVGYGHQKFAVIYGQVNSQIYRDRLGGFQSVLHEEGLSLPVDRMIGGAYSLEQGVEGAKHLLSQPERPTAIFCFNDDIAIGAIHEIVNQGLRVPEDISVVGFDNIRVSRFVNPSLTTIDQPSYDMGLKAAGMLFQLMEGQVPDRSREVMPFRLIERQSSGIA